MRIDRILGSKYSPNVIGTSGKLKLAMNLKFFFAVLTC